MKVKAISTIICLEAVHNGKVKRGSNFIEREGRSQVPTHYHCLTASLPHLTFHRPLKSINTITTFLFSINMPCFKACDSPYRKIAYSDFL